MAAHRLVHSVDITRVKDDRAYALTDSIIDEDILKIVINDKKTVEMVFSMTHTPQLVAGFLFTQSIVHAKKEITALDFSPDQKQCRVRLNPAATDRLNAFKTMHAVKGSSGGTLPPSRTNAAVTPARPGFSITPAQVLGLIRMHFNRSVLFHKTGAVHSAGLCTPDNIIAYFEDIGRHNVLDKLAGSILMDEIDAGSHVATVSCRMSLEIVGKIIRAGIPVVISNAAPTLGAVKLAEEAGLTVIGFARDRRFNIYTHRHRVAVPAHGSPCMPD